MVVVITIMLPTTEEEDLGRRPYPTSYRLSSLAEEVELIR